MSPNDGGIFGLQKNTGQGATTEKSTRSDRSYPGWNINTCQALAIEESALFDRGEPIGHIDSRQTDTKGKSEILDRSHGIGDLYTPQSVATQENTVSDRNNGIRNGISGQTFARKGDQLSVPHQTTPIVRSVFAIKGGQVVATVEGMILDRSHFLGDDDTRQRAAILEIELPDRKNLPVIAQIRRFEQFAFPTGKFSQTGEITDAPNRANVRFREIDRGNELRFGSGNFIVIVDIEVIVTIFPEYTIIHAGADIVRIGQFGQSRGSIRIRIVVIAATGRHHGEDQEKEQFFHRFTNFTVSTPLAAG